MTKKEKHMIAKNYLQRGRDIQRQITQLYEKRSEFIDRATSTTMAISPVKVQTSHSGQGLENAIIGMVETEEEIRNKIAELQIQQWNLQREIQRVHGLPYKQMLYKIFIERKSYDVARKEVNLKPVKVNNFLFMDNQERFENVCLGYSIQAERLMKVIQKDTDGKITKDWVTPERKMTIEQSSVIMETIQFQLLKLKKASGKYHKHIKNSVYCQQLLRPYISKLQKIIAEVDTLIGTGGQA